MTKLETVAKAISWKKSNIETAQKLNMSLEEFLSLKQEVLNLQKEESDAEDNYFELQKNGFATGYIEDLEKGTAEFKIESSFQPKTAEEIESLIQLDKSKWKLARYSVWNSGKPDTWLTAAKVVAISKEQNVLQEFQEFLKTFKPSEKPLFNIVEKHVSKRKTMLELSIADYHIDKMDGENITIQQRADQYIKILFSLLEKAVASYYLEEITFVIGNDFFNSDNYQNGTSISNHTQDNICLWDKSYEVGFNVLVHAIEILKLHCNKLNVICVQGNHAKMKEFFLGHALEAYFRKNADICFDRSAANRKIKIYGNTLIGYHHGNCKIDELPLLLATEFWEYWGKCKYKEVHTGDKHFYMEKDIKGVRVKQLPSLTGADRWHQDNNYVCSIRCAVATIYDHEKGKVCEFEERI